MYARRDCYNLSLQNQCGKIAYYSHVAANDCRAEMAKEAITDGHTGG